MSKTTALRAVRDTWTKNYPDIPWTTQELSLPVHPEGVGIKFQLLFGDLSELPRLLLELHDGTLVQDQETQGGLANWQFEEAKDGVGFILTLNPLFEGRVRHLILKQNPDGIRRCPVVMLQQIKDEGEWIVVYNSQDRLQQLAAGLHANLSLHSTSWSVQVQRFLGEMLAGNYDSAANYTKSLNDGNAGIEFLKWICERYRIEFNAHGAKRTFRFWSTAERQHYLKRALDVIEALRSINGDICISGGAILGYQRQGTLLDHDDDLDIVVGIDANKSQGLGPELDRLACHLRDAGFRIKGHFFAHLWVVIDEGTGQTLDVFVAMLEGDRASFYPSHRRSMPRTALFPAGRGTLEGINIPMPGNIDQYLEGVYGPNWRLPDKEFQHPWDRSEYADLNGPRKHPVIRTRGEVFAEARRRSSVSA